MHLSTSIDTSTYIVEMFVMAYIGFCVIRWHIALVFAMHMFVHANSKMQGSCEVRVVWTSPEGKWVSGRFGMSLVCRCSSSCCLLM